MSQKFGSKELRNKSDKTVITPVHIYSMKCNRQLKLPPHELKSLVQKFETFCSPVVTIVPTQPETKKTNVEVSKDVISIESFREM